MTQPSPTGSRTDTLRPAPPPADHIDRTVLLALRAGQHPTLEDAVDEHARTGVLLCADIPTATSRHGQASLLTAVATAARAFGHVQVLLPHDLDPAHVTVLGGPDQHQPLDQALAHAGAERLNTHHIDQPDPYQPPLDPVSPEQPWPVVLLGHAAPLPLPHDPRRRVLRAWADRWTSHVAPASDTHGAPTAPPTETPSADGTCILASIAAAALAVHEAFEVARQPPGSDAGWRPVALDLWDPTSTSDTASAGATVGSPVPPPLSYAPDAWWLIGLGHLGQANTWVLSWLPYTDPAAVEVVLQDTDRTAPANHSTGLLTPAGSTGVPKTRLAAAALEAVGYRTRLLERRLHTDQRTQPTEPHVALLGVDNLPTRRLTSGVGWTLAVDAGLGDQPSTYDSVLLRTFPSGPVGPIGPDSAEVPAWADSPPRPIDVPENAAFRDLAGRYTDGCGLAELAGKAVGVAFVGTVTACLAIAEALRPLHDGPQHQLLRYRLGDPHPTATASQSAPMATSYTQLQVS